MISLLMSISLLLNPLSVSAGDQIFVLANSAKVYEAPSFSSAVVCQLDYDSVLNILDNELADGFYHVSFTLGDQTLSGYVYNEVAAPKDEPQQVVLSYNATVSSDTAILSSVNDETLCNLKKGTRVLLIEGYDKHKEFLAVKFMHEGKVLIGRIDTADVKPDGVSAGFIVAITAIVAIVSIIIILLGITSKKRHKRLKN